MKDIKTKSIPLALNDEVFEPGMLFAILSAYTRESKWMWPRN